MPRAADTLWHALGDALLGSVKARAPACTELLADRLLLPSHPLPDALAAQAALLAARACVAAVYANNGPALAVLATASGTACFTTAVDARGWTALHALAEVRHAAELCEAVALEAREQAGALLAVPWAAMQPAASQSGAGAGAGAGSAGDAGSAEDADVLSSAFTPLCVAAWCGNRDALHAFLKAGAWQRSQPEAQRSALCCAALACGGAPDWDVWQLLVETATESGVTHTECMSAVLLAAVGGRLVPVVAAPWRKLQYLPSTQTTSAVLHFATQDAFTALCSARHTVQLLAQAKRSALGGAASSLLGSIEELQQERQQRQQAASKKRSRRGSRRGSRRAARVMSRYCGTAIPCAVVRATPAVFATLLEYAWPFPSTPLRAEEARAAIESAAWLSHDCNTPQPWQLAAVPVDAALLQLCAQAVRCRPCILSSNADGHVAAAATVTAADLDSDSRDEHMASALAAAVAVKQGEDGGSGACSVHPAVLMLAAADALACRSSGGMLRKHLLAYALQVSSSDAAPWEGWDASLSTASTADRDSLIAATSYACRRTCWPVASHTWLLSSLLIEESAWVRGRLRWQPAAGSPQFWGLDGSGNTFAAVRALDSIMHRSIAEYMETHVSHTHREHTVLQHSHTAPVARRQHRKHARA